MAALRFRNLVEVLAESGDTYGYSLQQRKRIQITISLGRKAHTGAYRKMPDTELPVSSPRGITTASSPGMDER